MAEDTFISLKESAEAVIEIKKSIFIGNAKPVLNTEEAEAFISEVRSKNADARHIAFAYVLRDGGLSKYSDDGEPQGTAGLPMLEILKKNGLCNTAVTVTRYFGGILLGASGLCRAYGNACAKAVENGGVCVYAPFLKLKIKANYQDFPKAEYELRRMEARMSSPEFANDVEVQINIEKKNAEALKSRLKDLSAARIIIETLGENYLPLNI